MRAFTISENVKPGLRIMSVDGSDPVLIIGQIEPIIIGTAQYIAAMFKKGVKNNVLTRTEGSNCIQTFINNVDIVTKTTDDEEFLYLRPSNRDDNRNALVHVETAPGGGGRLWFTAGSYEEVFRNGRVQRDYNEFPPIGVEVLASGYGSHGGQEMLIQMLPGSQFRINRNGDLHHESAVGFTINWDGFNLKHLSRQGRTRDDRRAA